MNNHTYTKPGAVCYKLKHIGNFDIISLPVVVIVVKHAGGGGRRSDSDR